MREGIESCFPGLQTTTFAVTSAATRDYNCVAWAAGDTTRWWWPDLEDGDDVAYWPEGIANEETVDAFITAFSALGYVPCAGEEKEAGFEKVAIFANGAAPTHIARQLPTGRWTSKLGQREDIEHDLHAVEGDAYGMVVRVLKRPLPVS